MTPTAMLALLDNAIVPDAAWRAALDAASSAGFAGNVASKLRLRTLLAIPLRPNESWASRAIVAWGL